MGDLLRRVGLHPWDDVGVLLECEAWALVAEAFADYLRWNTGSQRNRSVGVPEPVLMPTSA
ncbi:hypothetical protein BN381_290170 [Candidatus Microthrix parvicella RN1]|uniref:Uncharacterized protein n=1 Tax=Candidatus Neomicrothrix parvicella RN1 TaxID=1229780 RepID=R4Z5I8_9ACTN|nr:hypothetical protein BN381_290170 [Candidatus Microthrix parvicella RN1]